MITEPVTPRPDPYGRLLRRRRFGWLRRGGLAGLAALATAAAATAIGLSPASPPPTPVGVAAWIDAVVDAPPRGALGGDEAFRRDMQDRVVAAITAVGAYHPDLVAIDGKMHPDAEVRLVFADDIDDRRVAVLALRLAQLPDPDAPNLQGPGRARVVWFSGPRGASAADLASALTDNPAPDVDSGSDVAEPLTIVRADEPATRPIAEPDTGRRVTWVGLAPPTCSVLTAPAANPDAWTPEPTGSYIVRSPATYRAEFWRVSCGSVIREQRTVPWSRADHTADGVDIQALADLDAAGVTDPDLRDETRYTAVGLDAALGPFRSGLPRVRYVGNPPGLLTEETRDATTVLSHAVLVLSAPTALSTWLCQFVVVSRHDGGSHSDAVTSVITASDPAGAALAASVYYGAAPQVFAVLPGGTTAQLQTADGTLVSTSAIVEGFAALPLPDQYTTTSFYTGQPAAVEGLRVVAVDASGSPVAMTPVLLEGRHFISTNGIPARWDD